VKNGLITERRDVRQGQGTSLREAKRRSNPEKAAFALDCFASLAMTDVSMSLFHHIFFKMRIADEAPRYLDKNIYLH
jgi:hypothetical protein